MTLNEQHTITLRNTGKKAGKDKGKGAKGAKGGKGKKDNDEVDNATVLEVGRYIINPSMGVVPKQGYKSISITLDAQELKSFKQGIYLFIKHCSPHQPKMGFELTGESCSPGIDAHDFRNIFEEQSVVIQAPNNPYALTQNTFVVEDRAFLFTPIVLNQRSTSIVDANGTDGDGTKSNGTETNSNGERFKITNPFNVPCDVNFSVEPRMGPEPCPFILQQDTLHLAPHEYKYISCDFAPTNLDYYSAIFKAEVVDGQDEQTKLLTFELRGRGILPRLSLQTNLPNDELSRKVMTMGRVFVKQSSSSSFVVCNHGIIDAKYSYELRLAPFKDQNAGNKKDGDKEDKPVPRLSNIHQMFSVLTTDNDDTCTKAIDVRTKEFVLAPGKTQTVNVTFHPSDPGSFALLIVLNIDQNPFESTTIVCEGIAYRQDVTIFSPDLSVKTIVAKTGSELHRSLNFNDLAVGSVRRKQVTLTNHSHLLYRFVATLPEDFISIRPDIGHILPESSRILLLTLHAKQAAEIKQVLNVSLDKIKYQEDSEEIMEWDNTMTQFRRLTVDEYIAEFGELPPTESVEEEDVKDSKSKKSKKNKKVENTVVHPQIMLQNDEFIEFKETVKEPGHEVIEKV